MGFVQKQVMNGLLAKNIGILFLKFIPIIFGASLIRW